MALLFCLPMHANTASIKAGAKRKTKRRKHLRSLKRLIRRDRPRTSKIQREACGGRRQFMISSSLVGE